MYKDNNNIMVGCSYIGGSFMNIETKLILIPKKKSQTSGNTNKSKGLCLV